MTPRVMMWLNYRRAPNVSVPSPFDGDASIPSWYDKTASMAHGLAAIGITDVLFPQPCKTNAGQFKGADGYGKWDDYDMGSKNTAQFGGTPTRFGSAEKLRRAIAICRANGLDVHIDHVMHQLNGGRGGVYRYLGADGKTLNGRFPKDPPCFRGAPPRVPEDPVPAPRDDFAFGDELCPVNAQPKGYVWNGLLAASDWLFRTLGIQGARLDDMKGMAVEFMKAFANHGAMKGKFLFGEFASGNRNDTEWWVNQVGGTMSAFDFDFHYNMVQPMCNGAGSGTFNMGSLAGRGMIGIDPMHAVPFVESMDSDTNGFATIVDNKELGYALLLTSEGLPVIYVRDFLAEPDCYGLHVPIANLSWIHQNLANGSTVARYGDAKVFVFERIGAPGLVVGLNNDVWNPAWHTVTVQTSFGPNVQLHDYTGHNGQDAWTDGNGRVTFGIPPGANGRGYGCWSRIGLSQPIQRPTYSCEQIFFGAADLDIPPISAAPTGVGRIWCAKGTAIVTRLIVHTRGVKATLTIMGPDHIPLPFPSHTVKVTGWHTIAIEGIMPTGIVSSDFELTVQYTAPHTLTSKEF